MVSVILARMESELGVVGEERDQELEGEVPGPGRSGSRLANAQEERCMGQDRMPLSLPVGLPYFKVRDRRYGKGQPGIENVYRWVKESIWAQYEPKSIVQQLAAELMARACLALARLVDPEFDGLIPTAAPKPEEVRAGDGLLDGLPVKRAKKRGAFDWVEDDTRKAAALRKEIMECHDELMKLKGKKK